MKRESKFKLIIVLAFMLLVTVISGSAFARIGSSMAVKTTPEPEPTAAATPKPTPVPTPTPEPTPTPIVTEKLTGEHSLEEILQLEQENPYTLYDYDFEIYGRRFNLLDDYLDLNHIPLEDNGELAALAVSAMPNLQAADFDSCGLSNERCAEIRDANPGKEIIWRVSFGNYSVRTNVTKVLASKPSKGGTLYDDDVQVLKYCTKVRYLDLGHNDNIHDFSFVSFLPELEIAVISMTGPSSLSPFANCPNLLYLEAGNCGLTDISPLASCTKLKHLNIGTNTGVSDISCIYGLDLLRLWLGNGYSTSVPQEQQDEYLRLHPDCEINNEVGTDGEAYVLGEWKSWQQWNDKDWAYYSANNNCFPPQRPQGYWKVVYKAFQYYLNEGCYSFALNDPKYEPSDSYVEPVNTYVVNTSQLSEKWEYPDLNDPNNLVPLVLEDPPGEILETGKY